MTVRQISIAALMAAGLAWLPVTATAQTPATTAGATVMAVAFSAEADNKAVIERLYAAFAAGDGATLGTLLSPDLVWMEAEGGPYADNNPYMGPGAVFEGVFGRIGQQWQGFAVTPETLLPSGDQVVALGRYTGTNIATGAVLDAQFAHVFTLVDGKVVAFQQYTDTAQWVAAVTPH
jgi:ketosteroid isomerase-like protein